MRRKKPKKGSKAIGQKQDKRKKKKERKKPHKNNRPSENKRESEKPLDKERRETVDCPSPEMVRGHGTHDVTKWTSSRKERKEVLKGRWKTTRRLRTVTMKEEKNTQRSRNPDQSKRHPSKGGG